MVMTIIIVVFIAIVFLGAAAGGWVRYTKRRLRASFGPEVLTVARQENGNVRDVDRELRRRKNLHDDLDLHPISAQDQELYAASWKRLQGEFLDDPSASLTLAAQLVATVLDARGYPGGDTEEQLALLSVEHANSLADYRAAQRTSRRAEQNPDSIPTEEFRQALLSYHAMFTELLTQPQRTHGQEART